MIPSSSMYTLALPGNTVSFPSPVFLLQPMNVTIREGVKVKHTVLFETFIKWNIDIMRNSFLPILFLLLLGLLLLHWSFSLRASHIVQLTTGKSRVRLGVDRNPRTEQLMLSWQRKILGPFMHLLLMRGPTIGGTSPAGPPGNRHHYRALSRV